MSKYTIVDITEWEKDEYMMDGDSSHMPWSEVMSRYADEYRLKVEEGEWPSLPFTCEAKSKEDAIEKYNDEVLEFEYIRAVDADFEEDEDGEGGEE